MVLADDGTELFDDDILPELAASANGKPIMLGVLPEGTKWCTEGESQVLTNESKKKGFSSNFLITYYLAEIIFSAETTKWQSVLKCLVITASITYRMCLDKLVGVVTGVK